MNGPSLVCFALSLSESSVAMHCFISRRMRFADYHYSHAFSLHSFFLSVYLLLFALSCLLLHLFAALFCVVVVLLHAVVARRSSLVFFPCCCSLLILSMVTVISCIAYRFVSLPSLLPLVAVLASVT